VRRALLLAALAAASIADPAAAATEVPAEVPEDAGSGWVWQVSPYVWAAGIDGEVSPFRRAPTIPLDLSFGEVLDDLRMGGFVNLWLRHGRFVVSADVMYVDLTDRGEVPGLPGLGPTPGLSVRVDSRQIAATLLTGWRARTGPGLTLDLLAGLRWWDISTAATARFGGLSRDWDEDFSWVDPLLGFRAFLPLGERASALVQADVGLGARRTWQALGTLNVVLTDALSASAGYKALSVDYDEDGHVFDATLTGPVLGLTWRF
jgi:hypothetical protein